MVGALDGLRVIEIGEGIGAAFATKLLADYGADVITVEEPGGGSRVRSEGPFADPGNPMETGALHLYLDTNKQSVTLDPSSTSGQELLGNLLEKADAVVVDGRHWWLEELGLSEDARRERYPGLVVTVVSTYGKDGPYAAFPSTNLTSFAIGGQMSLTGDPDREPLKNGGYQADYQAGLNGFTATVAGLWAAGESGQGDEIDVAAMEVMASTLELSLNQYCYTQTSMLGGRRGNILSSVVGIYPCADGYLGVHAMPRNWPALARLMDMGDLLDDERFRDQPSRLQHEDELRAMVYAWASDKEKKEVYARAGTMRAPVAYVHDMRDLRESPHLAERQYFHEVEHPAAGKRVYPGAPFQMSGTPWRTGRAPLLGEHNRVIYGDLLGLSDADLSVLHGQGVI